MSRQQLSIGLAVLPSLLCVVFLADPVTADVCAWVDRATADKAVERIHQAGALLGHDWFREIAVRKLEIRRDGQHYEIILNGNSALDLAYVYLPEGRLDYRNLGRQFDCLGDRTPEVIPRQAFLSPAEATGFSAAPWQPDPDRHAPPTLPGLIGLLQIPELEKTTDGEVAVRRAPDVAAPVVGFAATWRNIASAEYDYGRPGAIVLERKAGWYRVALSNGTGGWIAEDDAGGFHGYPKLVAEGLAYLTNDWPGGLYDKAGDPAPARIIAAAWRDKMGGTPNVSVTGIAHLENSFWFKVTVLWPEPCSGEESKTIAEGWLPAYGKAGRPSIWFYSRGC